MWKQQDKTSRTIKNQQHKTPPKNHNNLPVIGSIDMEICDLPDKEFKIAILKMLTELWENIEYISKKPANNQENNTWTKWEVWQRELIFKNHKF